MINWDDMYAAHVRVLSDAALLAAYQRTSGEPGDPEAEALLAEIERRNLHI